MRLERGDASLAMPLLAQAAPLCAEGPLNTYFLLACADDLNVVAEADDGNTCIATAAPRRRPRR